MLAVLTPTRTPTPSHRIDASPCQDKSTDLVGKYAYIATGLGSAIHTLTFLLTWRFGRAADEALAFRLRSKASLVTPIPHVGIRP